MPSENCAGFSKSDAVNHAFGVKDGDIGSEPTLILPFADIVVRPSPWLSGHDRHLSQRLHESQERVLFADVATEDTGIRAGATRDRPCPRQSFHHSR